MPPRDSNPKRKSWGTSAFLVVLKCNHRNSDLLLRYQLAQDEGQNSSMLVVFDFDRRIDSASDRHPVNAPVRTLDFQYEVLLWLEVDI